MSTTSLPVPQGATIGQPQSLPVPQGATLGVPEQSNTGSSDQNVISQVAGGFEKGAADTVTGLANLGASAVEKLTGAPAGSLHATTQTTQPLSTAGKIGEGIENAGEFVLGGEALEGLEGLAKASKIVQLAKDYPIVAETLNLAAKNPWLAKIIEEGTKGAIVGGTQGGVKGAAEGKAKEGAEGGALGGGIGGAAATAATEALTPFAQAVAKKFGIGTAAVEDAVKGARPAKRNTRFAEDFLRAAPTLDAEASLTQPKSLEDWADTIDDARNRIWEHRVQPVIDRHQGYPLGGIRIADAIRAQITPAMIKYSPDQARIVEDFANQFLPGQVFALNVSDAEQALEHINAELSSTGYWSKTPSERAALLKTDGNILKYSAAADAIRDELYGTLEQLEPGSDMTNAKKLYGALRNIGNEVRGQVNVAGRQSPLSLKEAIGVITGIGHGGPAGAAIASLPIVDRIVNSPERLLARGVAKAARPLEEGAVSKGVRAAGQAVESAAPTAGAVAGANAGRLYFRASDGSMHSIPDNENALAHAKAIDPGLQVIPVSQQ